MAQKDRAFMGLVKCTSPAFTVGGLTALSTPPNPQLSSSRSVGVDPEHLAVMSSRPSINFTTLDIATVLANVGMSGLACTTLVAYFQKGVAYGTRVLTGSESISFALAYMIPRRITVSQEALATIEVQSHAISADGVTDPTTLSKVAVMPAGGAVAATFTMGPVSINSVSYDLDSGELDFGIAEEVEASNGYAYPELAFVGTRDSQFRFASKTPNALTDTGISGEQLTAFTWYLRKLDSFGVRIADNVAEHIKFTCTGYVHIEDLAGDPNTLANTAMVCTPIAGTITIDESSAIT